MKTTSLVRPILKTYATLGFIFVMAALSTTTSAAAPSAPAPVVPDGAVLVKRGDTLERVISRGMASMPFKPAILRKALIDKNPDAFTDTRKRNLKVGAILQLPTLEDFRHLLPPTATPMAVPVATPPVPDPAPAQAEAEEDPKKGWVRYP